MSARDDTPLRLRPTREDHLIAWLAALAIAVHVAEAALPSPLPGVKPGLANVVTVLALLVYGWQTAVWVSLLRIFIGSLIVGTFLSPTFVLSLAGGLAALAALRAGTWLPGLGPLGYCVLAALAHMGGQFAVAYALFVPHPALLHLLPVLMTLALAFGIVTGMIATAAMRRLELRP